MRALSLFISNLTFVKSSNCMKTTEEIKEFSIKALDEMKGIDIVCLDVRSLTDITDYMIICTGRSSRHIRSLAESVESGAKKLGLKQVRIEGNQDNEWILVDLIDVVVHVMLAATRSFYRLEDLWAPIIEMREQQK